MSLRDGSPWERSESHRNRVFLTDSEKEFLRVLLQKDLAESVTPGYKHRITNIIQHLEAVD